MDTMKVRKRICRRDRVWQRYWCKLFKNIIPERRSLVPIKPNLPAVRPTDIIVRPGQRVLGEQRPLVRPFLRIQGFDTLDREIRDSTKLLLGNWSKLQNPLMTEYKELDKRLIVSGLTPEEHERHIKVTNDLKIITDIGKTLRRLLNEYGYEAS